MYAYIQIYKQQLLHTYMYQKIPVYIYIGKMHEYIYTYLHEYIHFSSIRYIHTYTH